MAERDYLKGLLWAMRLQFAGWMCWPLLPLLCLFDPAVLLEESPLTSTIVSFVGVLVFASALLLLLVVSRRAISRRRLDARGFFLFVLSLPPILALPVALGAHVFPDMRFIEVTIFFGYAFCINPCLLVAVISEEHGKLSKELQASSPAA